MKHPVQPIYVEVNGVTRFKPNKIIQFLFNSGRLDLNEIVCMEFPREDHVQLAQLLGYSVYGFGYLSYVDDEDWDSVQLEHDKVFCDDSLVKGD
jgi:hypothetical protein